MLVTNNTKTIVCRGCGERKPVSEFYVSRSGKALYASNLCKECKKERVRWLYYSIRNRTLEERKEKGLRTESQPEFYKVEDCVVYVRLVWYSKDDDIWYEDFVPVLRLENDAECYRFIAIARDLPTADFKQLHREYMAELGLEDEI